MYKTVSAKATEETKIIKISFTAFKDCFEKYPEDLAKVVQVVMIRLQRVTLLALHQYLGLGAELLTHTARGGNQSMYLIRKIIIIFYPFFQKRNLKNSAEFIS